MRARHVSPRLARAMPWWALVAAAVLSSTGPAAALDYLAKPYLTNPRPDGMTIAWITAQEARATVLFGTSPSKLKKAEVWKVDTSDWRKHQKVFIQKVRIRGLKPATRYSYKVTGAGLPDYKNHFRTIPTDTRAEVLFCFGGDYAQAWPGPKQVAFVEKRVGKPVDFFLDLGDHAITRRFREEWQGRIPVVLAKGNHDNEKGTKDRGGKGKPGQIQHFYDYEGDRLNFSLAWGPLFIVVDGTSPYKPLKPKVYKWVETQYKSTKLPWRIFACHGVFFTDASHEKEGPARVKQMWPLFRKYGIQMQFNGHSHVYTRTRRINAQARKDPRGTMSINFGGLNQGSYWKRPKSPWVAYAYRDQPRIQGVAFAHIKGKTARLEFWTGSKRSAPTKKCDEAVIRVR